MIITVTLNAAMDKTLEVPSFTPGRRHRTVDQTTMPGGKGVNIARAIKRLGQPVIATGFAGGPTGSRIIEALNDESILNDFVRITDESRTNTAVLDPTTGLQTEINERGPAVAVKELDLFREKLLYLDDRVVEFFNSGGDDAPARMNAVLLDYVESHRKRA